MYALLQEQSDPLVAAVKTALSHIGFLCIIDVDEENAKKNKKQLDEDLRIEDQSPLLLVEIKGLGGLARKDEAMQASTYVAPRMREMKRHDIQALAIINHQRNIPALDRENDRVFLEDTVECAIQQGFGLMTTWDVFRLLRSMKRNKWRTEDVKPVFYRVGRIEPIPAHYELLGTVERLLSKQQVVSVRICNGLLHLGDIIAIEGSVEMFEYNVTSMQVDREIRADAKTGELVGIKIELNDEFKLGMRVFVAKKAAASNF